MTKGGNIQDIYNPNLFFVCCMATRPGVQLFATKLEYKHYPPRTPKNDLFNMNVVQWQGLTFYVLSVPDADRHICRQVAESIGMRLADGVPTMIGGGDTIHFPLQGKNVWTLEGQFAGNEQQEVQKIFDGDQDQMLSDFQTQTKIVRGTPADLNNFMETALELHLFSPMLPVLFGGERLVGVDTCIFGYIQEKPFSVCSIASKNSQPEIRGLYVIPRARRLGIGTRLFQAALSHCINIEATPVRVDVMSVAVLKMIEKLPPEMGKHLKVRVRDFDLTAIEQSYIDSREWPFEEEGARP